ncbi:acyl-CoA dehydrogenase family protein [Ketobacter sp.]|uniref:acyl-CoA dehydrogenase family protein n=1 Tax=Ketobacter sp. TaxID=2083498 RepID=UPI000F15924C|nr:acyl-CoA dehydrogenase family protein [Ketobacter sp.]RLT93111.1 MAG: acyl-CoA dehydrogenase [Ketobacter sp.]
MEFAFTEEQNMIRDTAESFLREVSTSNAIRAAMESVEGYDPALWQSICQDLYWQAIHTPEAYGGMGLGYVELVAMQEQMGRFLLCSPFFASVGLATNALLVAGTEQQKQTWLPELMAGKTATLAFGGNALAQRGGTWHAAAVEATWQHTADGYVLNGEYRYVLDATTADILILTARQVGSVGAEGVALFVVAAAAEVEVEGIERSALPTMDQTRRQGCITLNSLRVPAEQRLGDPRDARGGQTLQIILDLATIALAAEQMGGAQQLLDMTVAYSKERTQFGRPIAGFQAIKHKAADMMLRVEVARSGVYYAACIAQQALDDLLSGTSCDSLCNTPCDTAALAEAASIAKSYCSEAYFKNAGEAIQIHGGVGFTWEYDVHLYFKRAKASEHYLGNAAWHRERLASLLLDTERLDKADLHQEAAR